MHVTQFGWRWFRYHFITRSWLIYSALSNLQSFKLCILPGTSCRARHAYSCQLAYISFLFCLREHVNLIRSVHLVFLFSLQFQFKFVYCIQNNIEWRSSLNSNLTPLSLKDLLQSILVPNYVFYSIFTFDFNLTHHIEPDCFNSIWLGMHWNLNMIMEMDSVWGLHGDSESDSWYPSIPPNSSMSAWHKNLDEFSIHLQSDSCLSMGACPLQVL